MTEETQTETNEETQELTLREKLGEKTVAELREFVDKMNEDRRVRVPYGSKKDDTIQNIVEQEFYENLAPNQSFANVKVGSQSIPLSMIERCPLNPRHEVDYLSVSLQDSLERAGGLTKSVTVIHASELGHKEDVFYAIAGNRSLVNLKEVVTNRLGQNLDDYFVECMVRSYDSDGDVEAQILSDLESDNEEALDFSPIDKLRLINVRLDAGRSKSSIAKERGVSAPYITEITKLNVLPERVLELIHFGSRLEHLEQKTVEELEQHNVPFVVEGKVVEPRGITYSNGVTLASEFPAKPTRSGCESLSEYQEQMAQWEQDCEEFGQSLLEDDAVMEAAMTLSANPFRKFLKNHLSGSEGTSEEPPNTEQQGGDDDELEASGDDDGPSSSSDGYTGVGHEHNLVRLLMEDGDALADKLEAGDIEFVEGWGTILAERIRLMDGQVIRAMRTLLIEGAVDEF